MSRWLVGSSSSSASGCISRMRASATRIFQPPESSPTSPSTCSGAKPRPGEDLARARLERVAAERLEARLHLAEALDQRVELVGARGIGHRVLELVQLARGLGHLARAGHRRLDHAPALHLADVLAEVADRDAAIDARPARRRAAPRARSSGRSWSCRRRSGRPGRSSRRGTRPPTPRGRGSARRAAWRRSRGGSRASDTGCGARRASRTARALVRPASARRAARRRRSSRARARGARARCAPRVRRSTRCARRRCRPAAAPARRCSRLAHAGDAVARVAPRLLEVLAARLPRPSAERERGAARRVLLLVVVHSSTSIVVAVPAGARPRRPAPSARSRRSRSWERARSRASSAAARSRVCFAASRPVVADHQRQAAACAASASASVAAGEEKSIPTSAERAGRAHVGAELDVARDDLALAIG